MSKISPYIYEGGILGAALADQGVAVAANTKRIIQSAALVNTTAAPVLCSVQLFDEANVGHPKISARPIAPGETYLCPELIGKGLNALGKVQALGAGVSFDYTAVDIV